MLTLQIRSPDNMRIIIALFVLGRATASPEQAVCSLPGREENGTAEDRDDAARGGG